MRTHPHWIMLVPATVIVLIVIFVVQVIVYTHPVSVVHLLHANTSSAYAPYLRFYYSHGMAFLEINFLAAVPFEIIAYVTWSTSYIEVTDTSFVWTSWPTRSENIALASIADITWEKPSITAFLLRYGTLVIDAGRIEDRIPFVPNVENVARMMRSNVKR